MILRLWPLCLLVFVLVLQGCSGGGGDEAEDDGNAPDPVETGPAAIEGVWGGTATPTGGAAKQALLMADRTGATLLYVSDGSSSFVVRGDACCNGNVDGDAEGWRLFGKIATAVPVNLLVTSLVSGSRSISGDVTVEGTRYAVNLSSDSSYEEPISLQSVSGVYTRTTASGTTYTFAVNNDVIDGSDSTGCIYYGQLSIPDVTRNLFKITSMQMSGCPAQAAIRNGAYTGFGHLDDLSADSQNSVLLFVITGPVTFPPVMPVK